MWARTLLCSATLLICSIFELLPAAGGRDGLRISTKKHIGARPTENAVFSLTE